MTMAPELQGLLPDVLADYLNSLIAAETEGLDGALMECRLEIGEMGGRPVQALVLPQAHLLRSWHLLPPCGSQPHLAPHPPARQFQHSPVRPQPTRRWPGSVEGHWLRAAVE